MKTIKLKGLDIKVGKSKAFAYETPDDYQKHINRAFLWQKEVWEKL